MFDKRAETIQQYTAALQPNAEVAVHVWRNDVSKLACVQVVAIDAPVDAMPEAWSQQFIADTNARYDGVMSAADIQKRINALSSVEEI